jgi:hypothetical protein
LRGRRSGDADRLHQNRHGSTRESNSISTHQNNENCRTTNESSTLSRSLKNSVQSDGNGCGMTVATVSVQLDSTATSMNCKQADLHPELK